MKIFANMAIALSLLCSSAAFAGTSVPKFSTTSKKLTTAQCTKLRSDLDKYVDYVNAWLAAQPVKLRNFLQPYVDAAIASATAYVNKVCPAPSYDNHYSVNSPYQCTVYANDFTTLVKLGIDSAEALDNSGSPFKRICTTFNGCVIASQKFVVDDIAVSAECQDPANQNVRHLTDIEMQTKVNAIP